LHSVVKYKQSLPDKSEMATLLKMIVSGCNIKIDFEC